MTIDVPAPSVSGAGAPEPFDYHDALIWKALICKYLCKKSEFFSRKDLYKEILQGEFPQAGAYEHGLRSDEENGFPIFNKLVTYCLTSLVKNNLIQLPEHRHSNEPEYQSTARLKSFCRDILRYDMLDVEELVNSVSEGERIIRNGSNFSIIIDIMQSLKDGKQIYSANAANLIGIDVLNELSKLGIIIISFNNRLTLSAIGERTLFRLRHH